MPLTRPCRKGETPFNHGRATSASRGRLKVCRLDPKPTTCSSRLCLQCSDQPGHELVHPEHLLAALDHDHIAAAQQTCHLLRLERGGVFVPAEALFPWQQGI